MGEVTRNMLKQGILPVYYRWNMSMIIFLLLSFNIGLARVGEVVRWCSPPGGEGLGQSWTILSWTAQSLSPKPSRLTGRV